jgi:hypothetical protein
VDPAAAAVGALVAAAVLVALAVGGLVWAHGAGRAAEARAGAAELGAAEGRALRAEAERDHARDALEEAKQLLVEAADQGARVVAEHAAVVEGVRSAPPGARLDAAERLLQQRAADRRARRAAATGAPAAGDAAPGPGAARPPGGDGPVA